MSVNYNTTMLIYCIQKNQNLRCIRIDEIFMIPCNILGTFAEHFTAAAVPHNFHTEAVKTHNHLEVIMS